MRAAAVGVATRVATRAEALAWRQAVRAEAPESYREDRVAAVGDVWAPYRADEMAMRAVAVV